MHYLDLLPEIGLVQFGLVQPTSNERSSLAIPFRRGERAKIIILRAEEKPEARRRRRTRNVLRATNKISEH